MNKILYSIILLSIAMLVGCNEDLLDIEQKGVKNEQNFYKTDEDAEEAVAAIYMRFRRAYCGNNWDYTYAQGLWLKCLLADELLSGGNSPSDQQAIQELSRSEVQSNNMFVLGYYEQLYETIYLSNLLIENFGKSADTDVKRRDVAEAYFFRALCHFELTTLWGNPPAVDHVLSTHEEMMASNSTKEQLWHLIETDLNTAINSGAMAEKKNANDKETTTRATLQAAQALLGKAYLYQGKYAEAKEQLKKVIDSKKYQLENDISQFYHVEGSGSKEYIFECNRHRDPTYRMHQGGALTILSNWPFGTCILSANSRNYYDFNNSGYGFFNPTRKLYDAFVAEEGPNGYRLRNTIITFEQQQQMEIYYNGSQISFYGHEGLFRMKWLPNNKDEVFSSWAGSEATTPVMRYADILLMMAEACVQTDDGQGAAQYLNMVRSRAKLENKNTVTMDDIKKERQLELAMEGVRFQDLIRWGDASKELADKGKKHCYFYIKPDASNNYRSSDGILNAKYETYVQYEDNTNSLAGWTPNRDELLPYPQNEIDVNPNIVQNPGY